MRRLHSPAVENAEDTAQAEAFPHPEEAWLSWNERKNHFVPSISAYRT